MHLPGPILQAAPMLGAPLGQQPQQQVQSQGLPGKARPIITQGARPMFGIQPLGFRPPAIRPIGMRPLQSAPVQSAQPPFVNTRTNTQDSPMSQLKTLRGASGLKHIPVASSLLAFKNSANSSQLSRDQFLRSYKEQLTRYGVPIPDEATQNMVFALFDKDNNNIVDMMELICGISLLCKGSEDEKIRAVFNMFDTNADGMISMDEMFKFLVSVYKVVLTPSVAQTMKQMGIEAESPEDLASVTSLECFKTADLNGDGLLSMEEFNKWFYQR